MNTAIKILTLTLITLLLNIQTTKAQCHIDDWTALKALYESTDGDNWVDKTGWGILIDGLNNPPLACDLGDLYGVYLNSNGRVKCIDLDGIENCNFIGVDGNGLTGNIPNELGNLADLTQLFLSHNNLTGNIPGELGSLTNLTNLKLAFNQLSGSIPIELSALNNLTQLSLSYNELSGNIPAQLGNLKSLTKLQLSSNQLTGTIPIELANLTSLIDLSLDSNQLSGTIPIVLSNLVSLNYLILNGNQFTDGIPPELGNLTSLTNLHLYSNNLSGAIPPELGNLISLDRLLLNTNQLSGGIPIELSNLINLTDLALNYNNLTGSIPAQLGDLSSLTVLRLEGNELTGTIPVSIGNLINLRDLNLSFNNLAGNIPTEIGSLTSLIYLSLGHNGITGSIPTELGNLNDLKELYLRYNSISGNIPSELGNLSSLILMKLNDNQLEGNIPNSLSDLNNLVDLSLANNLLDGNIPNQIGNLGSLKELYLNGNQLTGNILVSLSNLIILEELWLHENQFTGSIPNQICNLENLYDLRINSNLLSSCYPNCMSELCNQLTNEEISNGNNFDATWENFCASAAGACNPCPPNCPLNLSEVYPGDLNHDGIVNNQDIGLSGLFLYETGPPRATEHQNTNWYAHPANDWNRQQINNEDIKHFDCNGDGAITDDDRQAVEDNMGEMWSMPETVDPPETSDYQITLHPVEEINNNFLRINVALESVNGGDLILQGGHFTIDYGMQNQNIVNATMNFQSVSWLGVRNLNLTESIQNFQATQTIEIGFTRTDNIDATGSGIIGELILQLDNQAARLAETSNCMLNLQVATIGMHDSEANDKPVENKILQVNMCESTCENNWYINNITQFQNQYQSSNLIETEGFLIIGDEQQVKYQSNRVCLQPGFRVKAGADFKVRSSGCD